MPGVSIPMIKATKQIFLPLLGTLAMVFSYGNSFCQITTNNNVRTDVVKVPGVTDVSQLSILNMASEVSYVDGLGRPVQRVAIQASPLKKDMVQILEYDNLGRQPVQYLPYVAATNTGAYQANAQTAQSNFYQASGDKVANDTHPFAITLFDSSPLQRVTEVGAPGADWQPGSHAQKRKFRLNLASENIKIWTSSGPSASFYGQGQLSVEELTDENGNKVIQYTNKLGQLVLKKIQANTVNYLETIFVYDDIGNLIFQVSPEGVKRIANSSAVWGTDFSNAWASSYIYDGQNRLVEKKAPGAKPVYMVYDRWGRIVLTQDGNLRVSNKWAFNKFDVINRPILGGTCVIADSRATIQADLDANTTYQAYEDRTATALGYTLNTAYPTTIAETNVLSVNYYDDYDFNNNGADDYSYTEPNSSGVTNANNTLTGVEITNYKNTRGIMTGSRTRLLGASTWLINILFYDEKGNVIQRKSNNLRNTPVEDVTSSVYNKFTGLLTASKQVKKTSGTATVSVVNKLTYDDMNRLLQVSVSDNGAAAQVLAAYEYNELSQLIDKKLHKKADASFLQSVDYRYTIRGWLSSINNSELSNDASATNNDTNDLFGMTFLYNSTDAGVGNSPYYNGQISAVKWKTNDPSPSVTTNPLLERSYKYSYDAAGRLTSANYAAKNGSLWNAQVGAYDETIGSYDQNGNIESLQRYTMLNGATARTKLDELTYTYTSTSGNQLVKVADASANVEGFKDGTNTDPDYTYDDNGNLTLDKNKGYTIEYNELGKTSRIYFNSTKYVQYSYDASGKRLRKVVRSGSVTKTYDYIDAFVYEDAVLSYFGTTEGRVRNGKFEYFIKDHLGNIRISFEADVNGNADVVQENHYYAFGLNMDGIINRTSVPSNANKRLFNAGSELQDELNEEMYSTFFREYDPALGRLTAIDPMVDKYMTSTPYNFAFNDPVNMNDPMGAESGPQEYPPGYMPPWEYTDAFYKFQYQLAMQDGYMTPGEGEWLGMMQQNLRPSDWSINTNYVRSAGNNSSSGVALWVNPDGSIDIEYGTRKNYIHFQDENGWVAYDLPDNVNARGFPSFATLVNNYPLPYETRPDRTRIYPNRPLNDLTGDNFKYFNQCAIRVSIALRKSGVDMKGAKNRTNPGYSAYGNGNIVGATNLAKFLRDKHLGKPEVYDDPNTDVLKKVMGRQGIIYFQGIIEDGERSDRNVHIELWNKTHYMSNYPFEQMFGATTIWFWPLK